MLHQRAIHPVRRFDSFEASVAFYRAADFDECLETLEAATGGLASALRVRCLLRLRRETEALAEINWALAQNLANVDAAALLVLKGTAELTIGQFDQADASLASARARANVSGCRMAIAEAEYATAIFCWSQGRMTDMKAAAHKVLEVTREPLAETAENLAAELVVKRSEIRAKAYDLLGSLAAVRENFSEQAALIAMAFEELENVMEPERFFEARLLFNLAVLARELDLQGSFEFVSSRVQQLKFGAYTKLYEFHIRRSLGWCAANRGNHLGAFREFRLSAESAPSRPWQMVAVLDRALLARELKEQNFAQEELDYALRLCKSIDWSATRDEECFALFVLAQHVAPHNPAEARRLLDRFDAAKATVPTIAYGNKDRRLFAEVAYASAAVLRAEGERERATLLLQDCFEVWTQIGYTARAAVAAADLAELTQSGFYFSVAASEAQKRPKSWLTSRLRSIGVRQDVAVSA